MQGLYRLFRFFLISFLAVVATGVTWLGNPTAAIALQFKPPSLPIAPVEIAMRIDNIYGFSTKEKTYAVEGSFWLSFDQATAQLMTLARVKPIDLLSFYNMVQPWDSQVEPLSQNPLEIDNSRLGQGYQFNGLFYSDVINYQKSPFGQFPLTVILQPKPGALEGVADQVMLSAKPGSGEVGSRIGLSGFDVASWRFLTINHSKESTLGFDQGKPAGRVVFEVIYQNNGWASAVKWILPLFIVMLVMLLTPNLRNSFCSERLAIPPVILLTLVFMQQSYRETLPTLPYLTFLDELYAFSYLVTLVFFIMFIWTSNLIDRSNEITVGKVSGRIQKFECLLQLAALSGYAALAVNCYWMV